MSRLRTLSTGAWIAIGLVAGSILAPAAAVAAQTVVGIVGPNNARAGVTYAGQLRTAEAPPSAMQVFARNGVVTGPCGDVTANVGARGYVMKQVVFDVYADSADPGPADFVAVYTDAGCAGQPIAIITPATAGVWSYPLDPGFAIQPGGGLWTKASGQVESNVTVYGYTVPATDVPATTPIATPSPS